MFLRPNYAIAVSLLGLLYVVTALSARSYASIMAAMAGLAFALWMPLHNYLYGHQIVLISLSGTTISITLTPLTYLQAAYELLTGAWNGHHFTDVMKQLSDWLWALPRLPHPLLKPLADLFLGVKVVTLVVTFLIAFRLIPHMRKETVVLAWTAIATHVPLLFVFAPERFRYAMLAWDLSLIVTIVLIARFVPLPVPSIAKRFHE